ncbi:uncharacterized protein [Oryctolagus cuniculus]|uniref:uncharacterized protein n=1 Tax=Oryctolagus cuniculus TaxID=9986 RepID=UPI00387A1DFB
MGIMHSALTHLRAANKLKEELPVRNLENDKLCNSSDRITIKTFPLGYSAKTHGHRVGKERGGALQAVTTRWKATEAIGEGEAVIPSHKMVALTRRPAHLGAPHASAGPCWPPPAGRAPQARRARGGLRGPSLQGPPAAGHPRLRPGEAARTKPAAARSRTQHRGPDTAAPARTRSALTSDAPREQTKLGKGGGAARMNGAGGCGLATSGLSPAAPFAAAWRVRPPPPRPGRRVPGCGSAAAHRALRRRDALAPQRLQPLQPRRARAHRESPRPRRAAPPWRRGRRPASLRARPQAPAGQNVIKVTQIQKTQGLLPTCLCFPPNSLRPPHSPAQNTLPLKKSKLSTFIKSMVSFS